MKFPKICWLLVLMLSGPMGWAQSEPESSVNSLLLKSQEGAIQREYSAGDQIEFIMMDRRYEKFSGEIDSIGDSTIIVGDMEFPVDKIGSVIIWDPELLRSGTVIGIIAAISGVIGVVSAVFIAATTIYSTLLIVATYLFFLFGLAFIPLLIIAIVLLGVGGRKRRLIGNLYRLAIVRTQKIWLPRAGR